jgi:hypothetical protein
VEVSFIGGKYHGPAVSNGQTLSHNAASSTSRNERDSNYHQFDVSKSIGANLSTLFTKLDISFFPQGVSE